MSYLGLRGWYAGVKKKKPCKGQTTERTQQEGSALGTLLVLWSKNQPELWRDNSKEPSLHSQRAECIRDGGGGKGTITFIVYCQSHNRICVRGIRNKFPNANECKSDSHGWRERRDGPPMLKRLAQV